MYILAINGSPHGQHGNTDLVLQNVLKGMASTGATTATIYLNKLNIKPCNGCVQCWFKTPGQCVQHDDMAPLLKKVVKADLIIYATPLYVFSMTGLMKNFLDRCLPLVMPDFEGIGNQNKITAHPSRYARTSSQKMLLISTAAFPEEEHFTPLVQTFRHLAKDSNDEYLGEILKPASGLLKDKNMRDQVTEYYADLFIAGKKLIVQGKIDDELNKKLRQPWVSAQKLREITNQKFGEYLKKQK